MRKNSKIAMVAAREIESQNLRRAAGSRWPPEYPVLNSIHDVSKAMV